MSELSLGAVADRAKCVQLEKNVIGNNEEKFFQVGVQLPPREKEKLIGFLRNNIDMFTGVLTKPSGWIRTSFVTI